MSDKDVSWLWHLSDKFCDVTPLHGDTYAAREYNKGHASGIRIALRILEDLNLITMDDIDRGPEQKDFDRMDYLTAQGQNDEG
jgi:hypothetical protein